jgi:hypothetical protein
MVKIYSSHLTLYCPGPLKNCHISIITDRIVTLRYSPLKYRTTPPPYGRIIPQLGFNEGEMYKKKKVAALKHRRHQKKLKEKSKAQAPEQAPEKKLKEKSKAQAPEQAPEKKLKKKSKARAPEKKLKEKSKAQASEQAPAEE